MQMDQVKHYSQAPAKLQRGKLRHIIGAGFAAAALWACAPAPPPPSTTLPTANAQDTARFYARLQNRQIVRGLLRQDGGGPDTAFTARHVLQNFRDIAFRDEYASGGGFSPLGRAAENSVALRKWVAPVRIALDYGPNVRQTARQKMQHDTRAYATRLQDITGHSIKLSGFRPNFHILYVGVDDRDYLSQRLTDLAPRLSPKTRDQLLSLPLEIRCLVLGFGGAQNGYTQAIAIIRAEHPDLLRKSCLHEELAQGLGLVNDSPNARPSIFNDDDEFALLTTHDEYLLRLLYDPRLHPGMRETEALPILRDRLAQLMP